MTSAEIQTAIVETLRHDARGLDQFQIGEAIDQAPFRVRAELRVMRRTRLVRDYMAPGRLLWALTAHGWAHAYSEDQLRLSS